MASVCIMQAWLQKDADGEGGRIDIPATWIYIPDRRDLININKRGGLDARFFFLPPVTTASKLERGRNQARNPVLPVVT